jgi:hypothetical protein
LRNWVTSSAKGGDSSFISFMKIDVVIVARALEGRFKEATEIYFNTLSQGRAMAQVVRRRPFTSEAQVHARVNPCGICGGQSGTGTGFSPSFSVLPCQYHSTVALQTHIIWEMRNMVT